jgi:hypothetical protein
LIGLFSFPYGRIKLETQNADKLAACEERMRRNQQNVRSAVVAACEAILFKSDLDRQREEDRFVLRRTLNELVWRYTEAQPHAGKYKGCPQWTQKARDAYDKNPKGYEKLVHLEHVVGRREIIDALIAAASAGQIRTILDRGETCVVLRTEHADLPKGPDGIVTKASSA